MEAIQNFAMEIEKEEMWFFLDIESGYHCFYLHTDMSDYFLLHYQMQY